MSTRALLLATCLAAAVPTTAHAQKIYAGRDASGTIVLSHHPIDEPTIIYAVPGAPTYVTTTPVESESARDAYDPFVIEHANRHSLRPELVRAVIQVESGYN